MSVVFRQIIDSMAEASGLSAFHSSGCKLLKMSYHWKRLYRRSCVNLVPWQPVEAYTGYKQQQVWIYMLEVVVDWDGGWVI